MSFRTILIAILALGAGGSAAVGVRQLAKMNRPQAADTVMVVIAKESVARGERLTAAHLTVQAWPAKLVPEGASTNLKEVEGRVTLAAQFPGQPIFDSQLANKDAQSGLSVLVPDGMRAFTIQMPNVQAGVAGFVLPGNKVDVLLTVTGAKSAGGGVTVTLLQNVEILAVDQKLDAPAKNKVDTSDFHSVTLLVTPNQAAKLSLAGNRGTLQLALRNPDDHDAAGTSPVTVTDLQPAQPEAPAVPVIKQQTIRIRTLKGSDDSYITVRPFEVVPAE